MSLVVSPFVLRDAILDDETFFVQFLSSLSRVGCRFRSHQAAITISFFSSFYRYDVLVAMKIISFRDLLRGTENLLLHAVNLCMEAPVLGYTTERSFSLSLLFPVRSNTLEEK